MSEIIQGTPEWFAARLGRVTASRVADVVARTKSGPAASRANYMAQLVAERLTGTATDGFNSVAMQWGTAMEPDARAAYEFRYDKEVVEVGFIQHPTIAMSGASPDGLIGDNGLVEIKAPNTATHIETLRGGSVPGKYVIQMQWQMACSGRAWCDFVSFDPRMPESMSLFVQRVKRDDAQIDTLEAEVKAFLTEVDQCVADLTSRYVRKAAA